MIPLVPLPSSSGRRSVVNPSITKPHNNNNNNKDGNRKRRPLHQQSELTLIMMIKERHFSTAAKAASPSTLPTAPTSADRLPAAATHQNRSSAVVNKGPPPLMWLPGRDIEACKPVGVRDGVVVLSLPSDYAAKIPPSRKSLSTPCSTLVAPVQALVPRSISALD